MDRKKETSFLSKSTVRLRNVEEISCCNFKSKVECPRLIDEPQTWQDFRIRNIKPDFLTWPHFGSRMCLSFSRLHLCRQTLSKVESDIPGSLGNQTRKQILQNKARLCACPCLFAWMPASLPSKVQNEEHRRGTVDIWNEEGERWEMFHGTAM